MAKLRKVIEETGKGMLSIYSNRGRYAYTPEIVRSETTWNGRYSIMGTIIEWTIPIV